MDPVTGPHLSYDYLLFPPPSTATRWFKEVKRYRQAPPYNLRLAYQAQTGTSTRVSGVTNGTIDAANIIKPYGFDSVSLNWAKVKAWDRFVDRATETASLGETLAEFHQSGAMLTGRILQFASFVNHLNHFRFGAARDTLGLPKRSTRDVWSKDRTVAQNIMEVQYGWRPLVGDMFNAMDVLTRSLADRKVRGRGTEERVVYTPGPMYSPNVTHISQSKVQYLADIRVSNPNLALLSALGLTNPLGTLAALVPYSFVLDWFTNFQQALAGYNRFMGLTIINPCTTEKTHTIYTTYWNGYGWRHLVEGDSVRRTRTLKVPTFTVKPFKGWSPERALNAISLLVLQLPKRAEDRNARASGHKPLPFNWDTGRKPPRWWIP